MKLTSKGKDLLANHGFTEEDFPQIECACDEDMTTCELGVNRITRAKAMKVLGRGNGFPALVAKVAEDLSLTLDERDAALREQWALFGDIPMNPETECMEQPFLGFPAGTHREEIWHWFDERYSKGVYALLYGEEE